MLAYTYIHDCNFYAGQGVGDYSKNLIAPEKCIVVSEKLIERLNRKC